MVNEMNLHPENESTEASDDGRIKSMLETVSIPENLNARIKSRVRVAMLAEPCLLETANEVPGDAMNIPSQNDAIDDSYDEPLVAVPSTELRVGLGERTRRASLILAMAAALAGFAYLANQWRQPNEREWLVKQSHTILEKWEQDNPANLEVESKLADLPAPVREQMARVTLRGTRSLADLGAKFQGTLYRMDAADGRSLILVRLKELPVVRGMNSRFSILPTPSGGWSLVALQLNKETFVLAAECTEQQLMNYIRRPVVT